jgi:ferrochelatase
MPGTPNYTGLAGYSHDTLPQVGVLLVNLGTPEAPTAAAVRPYLAEFLGDPRVIEYPRLLWLAILHGVILRVRPKRSAHAYARIWTEQGSPLRVGSEALAAALQAELGRRRPGPIRVALAMRYGKPAVAETIAQLQREGVRRLLVLPLGHFDRQRLRCRGRRGQEPALATRTAPDQRLPRGTRLYRRAGE